jgi:uncharacterized protein YbjT (DUF2867 family)
MRLLVTGGSGFLGGYVLAEAAAEGTRVSHWRARPRPYGR